MGVLSFMSFCQEQAKHLHCHFSCRACAFMSFWLGTRWYISYAVPTQLLLCTFKSVAANTQHDQFAICDPVFPLGFILDGNYCRGWGGGGGVSAVILDLKTLFNNVSTFKNLSCMALHAISVFDMVWKWSPQKICTSKTSLSASKEWK